MNIEKLRADLELDEGIKYEIYLDHLGLPTFGIGHLITEQDLEYGEEVGTPVSEDRVASAFESDIQITLEDGYMMTSTNCLKKPNSSSTTCVSILDAQDFLNLKE
jgi:GH24 family phage-related lysozyme (muramidase)